MKSLTTAVVLAMAGTAVSAQTLNWNDPAGGLWFDTANWSPVGVPNGAGASASIGLAGSYTVTLQTASAAIDALSITNPGVTLDILGARTLTAGTLSSNALIRVNPTQTTSTTTLTISDGVLGGSGALQLFSRADFASANARVIGAGPQLVVPAGASITGSGLITASTFGNPLVLDGEIRAAAGFGAAPLDIQRYSPIDLSGGGELVADGAELTYTGTIADGVVREINGGDLSFGSVTLDNVTLVQPGVYQVRNGTTTTAAGGTAFPNGVQVNPANGTSTTSFRIDDDVTDLPALVELFTRTDFVSASTGTLVSAEDTLFVPPGGVVRGSGRITNTTTSGNLLAVAGEIRALSGFGASPLVIERYNPIDLGPGGGLVADGNALVYSGTISDGPVRAINGGTLDFGSVTLDNVTLDQPGVYQVANGTTTTVTGGTVLPNGVQVNPASGTSTTTFAIGDDKTPLPTLIELFTRTDFANAATGTFRTNQRTLSIPAGTAVRGSGRITNNVTSGNTLVLGGEIRALPGFGFAPLVIERYGLVDLSGGGELVADGAELNYTGVIADGTVREINGGDLDFGSVTLDNVQVVQPGPYVVDSGESLTVRAGTALPNGVRVNPGQGTSTTTLRIDGPGAVLPGTVELFTRADFSSPNGRVVTGEDTLVVPAGAVVRGSGLITNDTSNRALINRGTLAADPANGVAPLTVASRYRDFTQEGSGRLEVFVDPAGTSTTRIESANVTLDGALRAVFAPGYTPVFGDTFEIFLNPATGEFDSFEIVNADGLPFDTDLVPFVFYRDDGVFVSWTCVPDSNTDLLINILDVIDFITIWSAAADGADFNQDGSVNILDIVAFVSEWNLGCP